MSKVIKTARFASANDAPMELLLEDDGDIQLRILDAHSDRVQAEVYLDITALMYALAEIYGPQGFGRLLEQKEEGR